MGTEDSKDLLNNVDWKTVGDTGNTESVGPVVKKRLPKKLRDACGGLDKEKDYRGWWDNLGKGQILSLLDNAFRCISFVRLLLLHLVPLIILSRKGGKLGSYVGNSSGSTEALWQAFFANPLEWWPGGTIGEINKIDREALWIEGRFSSAILQRNPKGPDFKHKDTGEALWIEGRFNPPWVKSQVQLAILDPRMGSLQANDTRSAVSFLHGDDFTTF